MLAKTNTLVVVIHGYGKRLKFGTRCRQRAGRPRAAWRRPRGFRLTANQTSHFRRKGAPEVQSGLQMPHWPPPDLALGRRPHLLLYHEGHGFAQEFGHGVRERVDQGTVAGKERELTEHSPADRAATPQAWGRRGDGGAPQKQVNEPRGRRGAFISTDSASIRENHHLEPQVWPATHPNSHESIITTHSFIK